jgi:Protein of unknown function (DUF2971)
MLNVERTICMSDKPSNPFAILVDALDKWNAVFDASQIPELLYHYTDFDGLLGILSKHSLRATFSETLNDGSEWVYGKDVLKSNSRATSDSVRDALRPPADLVQPPPKSMFVTCFCEEPNLLSMWRSYTTHGGGFSLGFEGTKLSSLQIDNPSVGSYAARLVRIYYGKVLPEPLLALLESEGQIYAEWVLENMIKDDAFREEREWRIIVPDPPVSSMSFHRGHENIKASVDIKNQDGRPLPLKRLLYGPTLRDDEATKKTLTWMLTRYGYKDVIPEPSGIPYRL